MKRSGLFAMTTTAVVLAGIGVCRETKHRQKKAMAEGRHVPYGPYEACIKRPLDFILSLSALIILSPVFLVTAILVKIELGSPVIFTQERPGKDERIFKLYKFRTMSDERDVNGQLLPDEARLTKFGKALRAGSLDELPELFNILTGRLSWVGPRPLLVRYLPYYKEEERRRHDVTPGLTGASQIHGRNFLRWEDRFREDVKYVNHITFLTDLKIIGGTIKKVLTGDDVMQADEDKKNMLFDDLDKERSVP